MCYEFNKTRKNIYGSKIIFVLLFAFCGLVLTAQTALAQTAQPTPTPKSEDPVVVGGFKVTSSIELGVRGLSVNGSYNKFRSDLNYKPGFRFFDSSFLMEDKEGKNRAFDTLLVNNSGWSADPTGFTRVIIEKTGIYRFNANVRRVTYFNNLNNHALNEHNHYTRHKFGDFDLTVFPQSEKFRLNFGYSFDRNSGPGTQTVRGFSASSGDEFPVISDFQTRANDVRVGVDTKLLGFNLSFLQGYRYFKDDTNYTITAPAPGNNTTNTTALATFSRQFPVKGNAYYTLFNAHRTFAKKVDFTARIIYSSTYTKSQLIERITGRDSANNFVDLDRFDISGNAKRPQTRGDFGWTFLVTDKFTISETFTFDRFSIDGGEQFAGALFRRNAAGNPLATVFTNSTGYRSTEYRRYINTVEADYQFNNRVGFHIGYRYTNRRVELGVVDLTATSPVSATNPLIEAEEFDNHTNTLIAGMKIKPMKSWVLFWDVEHGSADNVFTRIANYKFTNFRVRSRWTFNKFGLNVSAMSKDNNNPSQTTTVPPSNFGADINNRIYSGSLDWTPTPKVSFNGGYTFQHLTSETAILIPVLANSCTTGSSYCPGFSKYFMRDHYAFFDVSASPHNRISVYASYRINKDNGQGNRTSTAIRTATSQVQAQPIFLNTSYPFQFQMPEVRVVIRLNKNIDWNVGYQYYDYKERFQTRQDYRAHLPYTSLRIYFGGPDR